MKIFSGVDAHLQAARRQVVAHLQDAFFHIRGIAGVDDVFFESVAIDGFGFFFIGQHQQGFVVPAENIVDIDSYQYLYLGDVAQFFP